MLFMELVSLSCLWFNVERLLALTNFVGGPILLKKKIKRKIKRKFLFIQKISEVTPPMRAQKNFPLMSVCLMMPETKTFSTVFRSQIEAASVYLWAIHNKHAHFES